MTRKRMRALKYSKQMVDDVSQLVYLHLRFHGYGDGQVDRLGGAALRHRRRARCCPGCTSWCAPTAPPATSAARRGCRPTTTTWSTGSPSWPPRRTSQRVRPDLDGNEIMQILGIPAGPQVGEAWRYLKELRLDRGPLSHDEAVGRADEVVERAEATAPSDPSWSTASATATARRRCGPRRRTPTSTATARWTRCGLDFDGDGGSTTRWPTSTATASPITRCSTTRRRRLLHRRRRRARGR